MSTVVGLSGIGVGTAESTRGLHIGDCIEFFCIVGIRHDRQTGDRTGAESSPGRRVQLREYGPGNLSHGWESHDTEKYPHDAEGRR